jgi:RNA polymerase sigma-70 factor (ECF subfamily)
MSPNEPPLPSTVVDLAILGRLFEEHRPKLVAMVRRRIDPALAGHLDAEGVVNEAFLVARRKWPGFEERSAASTYAWLYRIVRDGLIDAWRRETRDCRDARRDMPWPDRSSVQMGLGLVGSASSPSEAAVRAEQAELVRQALATLKESDREILWLRHNDDLTFAEAAYVLEVTESAATLRYWRALKRFKDLWQKLHPDESSP